MKMKKISALVLIILILVLALGCSKNQPEDLPPEKVTPAEENLKSEEITDPAELERLWQEYLYDSITTVGNTRKFNSPEEIDPLYVAEFCWFKYIYEYGKESLELTGENSSLRLFPLDTVLEYTEQYFNLTRLDVSQIEEYYYDPQRQAFTLNIGSEEPRPSYRASNPWGNHLDKVIRNSDGTITAILVQYDSSQDRRIELTKTFTLKEREDGSLYFVKGSRKYINNHLVALTGDYQRFDTISGFDGNMEELSMLGEVNGSLILAYTPYENDRNASLMLVDPKTMKAKKKLEFAAGSNFTSDDVSLKGQSIVIRLKDRVVTADKTLAKSEEHSLPSKIIEKAYREPQYNEMGMPDVFFGGYDVSKDGKTFVYADETGVKLFNTMDNSEKMLSPTVDITGSELLNHSYHRNPRFVDDEHKVVTTMTGYESTMGYTLCDLKNGTAKTYNITSESSSTGLIRYDTGLLEVNTHLYNQEQGIGECKTNYLDFRTGAVHEIVSSEPGDTGFIRMPDDVYVGQNYAAFITYKMDVYDNANSMYYLNRLNLKTFQTSPKSYQSKQRERTFSVFSLMAASYFGTAIIQVNTGFAQPNEACTVCFRVLKY